MPIYECSCARCATTFEVLAAVTEAGRRWPCPTCGRAARRIVSAFAIGTPSRSAGAVPPTTAAPHPHGPRRPRIPDYARLCWMDDRSAERFAAYKMGRGAEYDDKVATREEVRKQRGEPAPPPPDPAHSPIAHAVARKQAEKAAAATKAGAAQALKASKAAAASKAATARTIPPRTPEL